MDNSTGESFKKYAFFLSSVSSSFLRGKEFFLAHGMADRNVHFQHSMVLAKELVRSNVQFKQQVYPDEGHFLRGAKPHLFSAVGDVLQRCLRDRSRDPVAPGRGRG